MTGSCALVPEFAVRDWRASLAFYRDLLGFRVLYTRDSEGFAYLALGEAELMIDQIGLGRDVPTAPLEPPLGRGLNVQIRVKTVAPLLDSLERHGIPLVVPLEERWYQQSPLERRGQRQFVVADPDGYLLRFYEDLGWSIVKPEERLHRVYKAENQTAKPE